MTRYYQVAAGELNQRITINARSPGDDALGQANGAWAPLAGMPIWAKAKPARGRESASGSQLTASAEMLFVVRYRADIAPDQQVAWASKLYDIIDAVNIEGANQWLEIYCITGVRDGR